MALLSVLERLRFPCSWYPRAYILGSCGMKAYTVVLCRSVFLNGDIG